MLALDAVAAINVLVQGTTYLAMFDPKAYCLFEPDALSRAFAGWEILHDALDDFAAPEGALKRFSTVVARKPV